MNELILGALLAISLAGNAFIIWISYRTIHDLTLKIMARDAQEYVQIRAATDKPPKPTTAMAKTQEKPTDIDLSDEDGFDALLAATEGDNGE